MTHPPVAPVQHTLLPVASTARTRSGTWHLLARRPWRLAGTVAVLLAGTVASLATPAILGLVVNLVLDDRPVADLAWAAGALLVAGGLGAALGYVGQTMLAVLCETALADLREDVFRAAVEQPAARIEAAGTGDVVSRVSGDVEAVGEAISGVLPAFTSAAFTILLTLVGLGVVDWHFAVAALVAAPVQVLTLRWFLRRSGPVYQQVRTAEAERAEQIIETVSSTGTIAALDLGRHHAGLVDDASTRAIRWSLDGTALLTRFFNGLNLAELLGLATVLAAGFWLVATDVVTVGAATAAALYFHRLFDPVGTVLAEFDELQKAAAGLSRLFGLLDAPSAATGSPRTATGDVRDDPRSVHLDGVSFSYGGRPVLHDVHLTLAPGEHVAVVGASGAGKTTLAKIVLGLHAPSSGTVTVAGIDVAAEGPAGLRGRVGMVSQEVHVFSGSIAQDLRLADPAADDAALAEAVRRVGAGWVHALDDGIDTAVGDGGHPLAPEQAQQLALARLLLVDPLVAVLDEATAEAGTGSAQALDAAAREVLAGRTSLVIAHRLSQAVVADRVVVMAAGRVVEDGTHDELVRAGGTYAALWEAWATR
ncbi:ABC transporter ATP-binding protein [Sanguibacter sp. 25GB23B1]|uniref:ABC transporter ATP-binding protein n=1 Tax=unclassified Sanguibacter TaxID=2645534 RepID=UPI0032AF2772